MFITSPQDAERNGHLLLAPGTERYELVGPEVCGAAEGSVFLDIIRGLEPALTTSETFEATLVLDGTLQRDGGKALPRGSVLLGGQWSCAGSESASTIVLTVRSRPDTVDTSTSVLFDLDDVEDATAHNPVQGFFHMKARMLVDGPSDGTRTFTLGLGTFAPGTGRHALHRHANAAEFFYVWEGTGRHLSGDGASHPLSAGDLVYVPRNEWHGFRSTGPTPARAFFGYLGVDSRADAGYEVL